MPGRYGGVCQWHTPFCFYTEADVEKTLSGLLKLQESDSMLDRARAELEGIPGELSLVESELSAARAEFTVVEARLSELGAVMKKCEEEKADSIRKLAEYKTKLLSLRTNAEYKAMLEQISFVERRIDDLDSRILETMYEEDAARKDIADAGRKLERYTERANRKKELLAERESALKAEVDRLSGDRSGTASAVPIRLLRKYEQLRASGRSCAVVGLVRGACGGCHTNVPPQNAVEISQGIPYSCPICGRYIVDLDGNRSSEEDI